MASKNLTKASDWAQREIDALTAEHNDLLTQMQVLEARKLLIQNEIEMLTEIIKKLSNGVEEKPLI